MKSFFHSCRWESDNDLPPCLSIWLNTCDRNCDVDDSSSWASPRDAICSLALRQNGLLRVTQNGLFTHLFQAYHHTQSCSQKKKKKAFTSLWCDERTHSEAPSRVPEMQATSVFVSHTPPESNRDCASASYKSQPTAMMFQKQLFPSKNKHILGTCCGVHCLFSQCALLALGLAGVNHMLRLFPHFSLAVLLLSFATVRVLVY